MGGTLWHLQTWLLSLWIISYRYNYAAWNYVLVSFHYLLYMLPLIYIVLFTFLKSCLISQLTCHNSFSHSSLLQYFPVVKQNLAVNIFAYIFVSWWVNFFFILIFFFRTMVWTQGLHLEPIHQPFFVMDFFEIGSSELFAWAGFELHSSWSLSPEQLGLQAWATSTRQSFFIIIKKIKILKLNILRKKVLLYCPGWHWTVGSIPTSVSHVAGIIDTGHCA
jgi:hypothetical protein